MPRSTRSPTWASRVSPTGPGPSSKPLGGHARARRTETSLALTAQETQVARLVVEGDANREAAAMLFISPATVEYPDEDQVEQADRHG